MLAHAAAAVAAPADSMIKAAKFDDVKEVSKLLAAGIDPKKVIVRAMLASGAIAGLGGAIQVLAYEGRFYADFSPGYGFDGLGIALLAGSSAFGVIPAALLFGVLAKGGVSLGIAHIPKGITTVVLGMIILIAAALRYRKVKTVA